MIILDTNVVSELMRPQPAPKVTRWIDEQEVGDLSVTSVTVAEVLFGIVRLPHGARRSRLAERAQIVVHRGFAGRVLSFDVAAAEHYAELAAECERAGRPISTPDAQIAAICRCRGAALATRNTRDFETTGIRFLDPWTAPSGG